MPNPIENQEELAQMYLQSANLHRNSENLDAAITAYHQALEIMPTFALAHWQLGDIYIQQGKQAEALFHKQQAIELKPDLISAEAHNTLGIHCAQQGKIDEAIICFQRAIAVQPNYADAYYNLGNTLATQNLLEDAVTYFQAAVKFNPNHINAQINLAALYTRLQQYEAAVDCYESILVFQPKSIEALVGLANLQHQANHLEEAIAYYLQALDLQPHAVEIHCSLGIAFGQKDDFPKSLFHFQTAIEIDPNYGDAYHNLGITLLKQKKTTQAITYLEQALVFHPDNPKVYSSLGDAWFDMGELNQASNYYFKSIEVCETAEACYKLAEVLSQQHRTGESFNYYRQAIDIQPNYADAYWKLFFMFMRGQKDTDLLQLWKYYIDAYKEFCSSTDALRVHIAYIYTYLVLGLNSEQLKSEFRTLESLVREHQDRITDSDAEKLYGLFMFNMPPLAASLLSNTNFSKLLGELYVEKVAKPLFGSTTSDLRQLNQLHSRNSQLRIGFLSSYFYRHSVGWCSTDFMYELSKITPYIYLYATGKIDSDDRTAKFVDMAAKFYQPQNLINGLADAQEILQEIKKDNLDILIDLDSFTNLINVNIMHQRPVPICITWSSHDVPFISPHNYFLCDRQMYPDHVEGLYSEQLIRMPDSYLATAGFTSNISEPKNFRESLGISDNCILYLCVCPAHKFNLELASAQVRILREVPNSILVHKSLLHTEWMIEAYQQECNNQNVDFQRIMFIGLVRPEEEHRNAYVGADILLDTYPFNGGVITLEALWFELPIVTIKGEQPFSRTCYSFMKNLDINVGIATNWMEYIEWAIKLGCNTDLRTSVKDQLLQSKQNETKAALWNPQKFAIDMYGMLANLAGNFGSSHQ